MGGVGSTRWGAHSRHRTIEELSPFFIRVRDIRALLTEPDDTTAVMTWAATSGEQLGEVDATITSRRDGRRSLTLAYRAESPEGRAESVRQTVVLEARPARFGGDHWYLGCPGCSKRRDALYLAPGSMRFRCRRCARLAYHTQRLRPRDRLDRRACALARRLGAPAWTPGDPMPEKPKHMHWGTYFRRLDELRVVQQRIYGSWVAAATELLKRFGTKTRRRPKPRTSGARVRRRSSSDRA